MWSVRLSRGDGAGFLALALLVVAGAPIASAQGAAGGGFAPGGRTILALDFAGTPVGEFPKGLRLLQGNLEVVDKDGMHMLRASSPSEFVVQLPEALPTNFTLEFDLIPKACCNPIDLMVEGVISGSRSSVSAQLEWHPSHFAVVGGNSQMFQMDMPAAVAATLPSTLTRVAISFEDETIRMYTNGRRLYTLGERKFVRGRVLRISLGGQDDDKYAVYLASVRIADAATTIASSQSASSGSGVGGLLNPGATLSTSGGGSVPVSTSAPPTVAAPSSPGVTAGPLPAGTVAPTPAQTAATQPAALSSANNPLQIVFPPTTSQQQNPVAQSPAVSAPISASSGPVSSITRPASGSKLAGPAQIVAKEFDANSSPQGWGNVIAWTPVAGVTSYQVSRAVVGSGTAGTPIAVIDLPAVLMQNQAVLAFDRHVEPFVQYTYWVEGVAAVTGVLTDPSPVAAAMPRQPPPVTSLQATVSGTTQVLLPGSFGAGGPTRGSNVKWTWDPIPFALGYELSYEIVGKMGRERKTLLTSVTLPATFSPITYGVPQGGSVRFCVSVWAPAGQSMPLPQSATCLTTQVP